MKDEELKILYEIIQNSGQVIKFLLSSMQAMNDGDLSLCQKYTKEAQSLLKTMVGDVFKEYFEMIHTENLQTNDYDIATQEELIKQLGVLQYDIGVLLGIVVDNQNGLLEKLKYQTANDITTIIEIYNSLYNN